MNSGLDPFGLTSTENISRVCDRSFLPQRLFVTFKLFKPFNRCAPFKPLRNQDRTQKPEVTFYIWVFEEAFRTIAANGNKSKTAAL
jgi:hypothetical protein